MTMLDSKKFMRFIIGIISMTMILTACSNGAKKPHRVNRVASGIEVQIEQPAGELYNAIKFFPLPVNIAHFDNIPSHELECWIISKRIKASKHVSVDIFAHINYKDGSITKNIILATPTKNKYQTIETTDLMDFSVNHSGMKTVLDNWLKQYKGTKSSTVVHWRDKQEAMRLVQKYAELNNPKK